MSELCQLLVFKINRGCCTSQGDDCPYLDKCIVYNSKEELKSFFDEEFEISDQGESYQKEFWENFEENWNVGMSFTSFTSDCKDCGTVYVYGTVGKIQGGKRITIRNFVDAVSFH